MFWTGPEKLQEETSCICYFFVHDDLGISNAITKTQEIEKIPQKTLLTDEEKTCEEHFFQTYFRKEVRYGVRLPFSCTPSFPGSKEIAISYWHRWAKRLAKNDQLIVAYHKFMHEYHDLGYMELIPAKEMDREEVYYTPHHAIFKNN